MINNIINGVLGFCIFYFFNFTLWEYLRIEEQTINESTRTD